MLLERCDAGQVDVVSARHLVEPELLNRCLGGPLVAKQRGAVSSWSASSRPAWTAHD